MYVSIQFFALLWIDFYCFFVELYSVINVSISIAVLVGFLFWFVRSLFAECLVHILIDTFRAILSDRPSIRPYSWEDAKYSSTRPINVALMPERSGKKEINKNSNNNSSSNAFETQTKRRRRENVHYETTN